MTIGTITKQPVAAKPPVTIQQATEPITQPFRDDVNAAADRKTTLDKAMIEGQDKTQQVATQELGKSIQAAAKAPAPTATPPPAFQAFSDTLKQQDPLREAATQAITQQITQPGAVATQQADIERANLAKNIEEAQRQAREASIREFGGGTGQVATAEQRAAQEALLANTAGRAQISATEAAATEAERAGGLQNAIQLLGQQQQESQFQRAQIQEKELQQSSFDFQSRTQVASQDFAGAQANLDRELAKFTVEQQIEARAALQASAQTFQGIMQDKAFLNTKDLTEIDHQFQAEMQARGFDQETATLLTQINHEKLQAEADRIFNANQAEITRKWQTGERIDTQDYEKQIEAQRENFAETQAELDRTLQLDVQENQIAWEQARLTAEQAYDDARFEKGMDHETALAESNQVFQQEMQAAGFEQEQILQGQRLTQELALTDRQLEQSDAQFTAQLAQQDAQFFEQLGLDQQKVDDNRKANEDQIELATRELDLTERQINAALNSQEAQDAMGMLAIAQELELEDDAMLPFVKRVFSVMAEDMGMKKEDIKAAIKSFTGEGGNDTGPADVSTGANILKQFEASSGLTTEAIAEASSSLTAGAIAGANSGSTTEAIAEAKKNLGNLTGPMVQSIIDDPQMLESFQQSGIIEKKAPILDQAHMLRHSDWDAQGFSDGDIVVLEIDGIQKLIQISEYTSKKIDKDFLEGPDQRKGILWGVDLTAGERTPKNVWETGWVEAKGG